MNAGSGGESFGRLAALLGMFDEEVWSQRTGESRASIEWVRLDGQIDVLTATTVGVPADRGVIDWMAAALDDCRELLGRNAVEISDVRIAQIEKRLLGAAPAPWRLFLESDGGLGGGSVIWVGESDETPDLYLWANGQPAPDFVWEFIVEARNQIPALLHSIRGRAGGR